MGKRMRESMALLTPLFSTNRTVRQYTEQHDLPAASAYRERAANTGAVGREVVNWEQTLNQKWATLHIGDVELQTNAVQHIFEAEAYSNDLDPKTVQVGLYADGINDSDSIGLERKHVRQLAGASGGYI